jgi:cell division protein FtsQ
MSRSTWIKIIIIVLVIISLFCGWQYLQNSTRFPIEIVKINGDYHKTTEIKLEETISPFVDGVNFFALSPRALKRSLEALPWVETANVQRDWPSTIEIYLKQKTPIAVWNVQNLITREGTLFSPEIKTFPEGLPILYGPTGQEKVVLDIFVRLDQIVSSLNLHLESLTVSARHSLKFNLSNGLVVLVGQENMFERVARFCSVYSKIVGDYPEKITSIDLRYQNGLAVAYTKN